MIAKNNPVLLDQDKKRNQKRPTSGRFLFRHTLNVRYCTTGIGIGLARSRPTELLQLFDGPSLPGLPAADSLRTYFNSALSGQI